MGKYGNIWEKCLLTISNWRLDGMTQHMIRMGLKNGVYPKNRSQWINMAILFGNMLINYQYFRYLISKHPHSRFTGASWGKMKSCTELFVSSEFAWYFLREIIKTRYEEVKEMLIFICTAPLHPKCAGLPWGWSLIQSRRIIEEYQHIPKEQNNCKTEMSSKTGEQTHKSLWRQETDSDWLFPRFKWWTKIRMCSP